MLGTYHMQALLEALADLHHIHDASKLYSFVLNRCGDVLKSEYAIFYSFQELNEQLRPEATVGLPLDSLKEIPFKITSGIAGLVATHRKTVLVENAQANSRFSRSVDVMAGIRTRSVLCAPILHKAKLLGVIELINRVDGVYRQADSEFLEHFASQVALVLEDARLYQENAELLTYANGVINSLQGGFISMDLNGLISGCNKSASRILGLGRDLVGQPIHLALAQYPAVSAILEVTKKNKKENRREEIEIQRPDGSALLLGYGTSLIMNEQEQLLGVGILFTDLTALGNNLTLRKIGEAEIA